MNAALAAAQVVATVFVAATFVIYFLQLRTMRTAAGGQNILSLVTYLQSPQTREARRRVLTELGEKQYGTWDEVEQRAAAEVCASYDIAGILIRTKLVAPSAFLDNWGPSIVLCHQVLVPFIAEMRVKMTARYLDDFDWLADEVQAKYPVLLTDHVVAH